MMKSRRSRVATQLVAERLDARRVAQIEAENFQPIAPVVEIRFLRVTRRRVARKARRHDQARARAQQLDAGLIADLDASAGQQRDASAQIRRLGALGEIELRARRAQLVVEMMDRRILLLADIAMLRLGRFAELGFVVAVDIRGAVLHETFRRKNIRRREHRTPAQFADAGCMQHRFLFRDLRGTALARLRLALAPPLHRVGVIELPDGRMEALAILGRQTIEQRVIGRDAFEQRGGVADFVGERVFLIVQR